MESHPGYDRIAEAIASVEAPHSLRMSVESERDRTLVRRLVVRRMKLAGVGAGVAAVLGATVALVAPSGDSNGTGVPDLVALAGKASFATPAVASDPHVLRAHVADVNFPAWTDQGLRPTGQRVDDVGDNHVVTVFYADQAADIAYSIADGKAIAWPEGSRVVSRSHGIAIRAVRQGERNVVMWREHGLTCVMSATPMVPRERLVALAAGVARYYA